MDGYLELKRSEVLDFNDKILAVSKEFNMPDVLTQMQNYMTELLKSNVYNTHLKMKLLHDIKSVENAKKQLRLGMLDPVVAENLAFELILH